MYSSSSTKQIFEKLAHSSIMRLNKSSMDKLYDLMNMGFKRQIVNCNSPQQYLSLTLNHLESLKLLVDDPAVHELIQSAIDKSVTMYTSLSFSQLFSLKHTILRNLQDRRVKVSLFLQQGLQLSDGSLVLSQDGNLPRLTETPGKIRYFENGSVVSTKTFDSVAAVGVSENNSHLDLTCRLGLNMYTKDGSRNVLSTSVSSAESFQRATRLLQNNASSSSGGARGREDLSLDRSASSKSSATSAVSRSAVAGTQTTAKAELSLLSDLLGMSTAGGDKGGDSRGFRINLFPDTSIDSKGGDDKDGSGSGGVIHIDIDACADAKSMSRYMEELDLKDEDYSSSSCRASAKDEDEDDLLALMDSAK